MDNDKTKIQDNETILIIHDFMTSEKLKIKDWEYDNAGHSIVIRFNEDPSDIDEIPADQPDDEQSTATFFCGTKPK